MSADDTTLLPTVRASSEKKQEYKACWDLLWTDSADPAVVKRPLEGTVYISPMVTVPEEAP